MALYNAEMNSKSYFRIATLISESSGNSVYAENPEGALLIDAGRSKRAVEEGIEALDGDVYAYGKVFGVAGESVRF